MTEISTLTFNILLGLLALYFVGFWLVGIASIIVSYLHDGEKDYSSFYESERWPNFGVGDCDSLLVKWHFGVVLPCCVLMALVGLALIDTESGYPITPCIILALAGIYIIMRISRAVIRLNKRLSTHEKDKRAHK